MKPEQLLGKAVAQYLDLVLEPDTTLWTAINPVPGKTPATAGLSKAMGLKAGIPDYLIIHAGKAHFIELKDMSGAFTKSQREMFPRIRKQNIPLATCRSIAEVDLALDMFGIPHKRVHHQEMAAMRRAA